MESRYGQVQGKTPVFQALATLAWEPRRAKFFRTQLFDALAIAASSDVETDWMLGSWAGAMGQPQFMPSSYLQYAVDFDGDGWVDSADPDCAWGGRERGFESAFTCNNGIDDDVDGLVDSLGLKQVSDTGAIEEIVAKVLADNPKLVEGYLATPEEKRGKAMGPFIGLTRKAAKGVNPQVVMEVLKKKLEEL